MVFPKAKVYVNKAMMMCDTKLETFGRITTRPRDIRLRYTHDKSHQIFRREIFPCGMRFVYTERRKKILTQIRYLFWSSASQARRNREATWLWTVVAVKRSVDSIRHDGHDHEYCDQFIIIIIMIGI